MDRRSFQSVVDGVDEVVNIDESQFLTAEADSEVEMAVDSLDHHQVVALVGAVDAGRAEDYPGQVGAALEEALGLDFRQAVARVGVGHSRGADRRVAFFVAGPEGAQTAHVDQTRGLQTGHVEGVGETPQIVEVYAVEIEKIDSFRGAEVVDYVVPRACLTHGVGHCGCVAVEVEGDEFQARIGEIAARGRGAHAAGDVVPALKACRG